MKIELDMYQTLALSVLVLLLGKFLRHFYLCVLRYRRGRVRL